MFTKEQLEEIEKLANKIASKKMVKVLALVDKKIEDALKKGPSEKEEKAQDRDTKSNEVTKKTKIKELREAIKNLLGEKGICWQDFLSNQGKQFFPMKTIPKKDLFALYQKLQEYQSMPFADPGVDPYMGIDCCAEKETHNKADIHKLVRRYEKFMTFKPELHKQIMKVIPDNGEGILYWTVQQLEAAIKMMKTGSVDANEKLVKELKNEPNESNGS